MQNQTKDHATTLRHRTAIGELLRDLRGERTLRDVERNTGISNTYLSNLEQGLRRPGIKTLSTLSEYYEVPLNELLKVADLPHQEDHEDGSISALDIRRSFNFLVSDPDLYQYEAPAELLPLDAQRYIVQIYEHFTGKKLL